MSTLERRVTPHCAVVDHGSTACAVAHFADVPSAYLHQRRHRLCTADGSCSGASDRHLGGAGLDRVRHTKAEPATRRARNWAHCRDAVGGVAFACQLLGERRDLRGGVARHLGAPVGGCHPRRSAHCFQSADGLDLRADGWEPASGDAHACKPYNFHNYSLPSAGRNRQPNQWFGLCCRDVAGRCGGRHCPRRAPLATATSCRLRERLTSSDLPPFLRVDDRRASRWDIRRSQLAGTGSAQRPFVLRTWAGRPWPNED